MEEKILLISMILMIFILVFVIIFYNRLVDKYINEIEKKDKEIRSLNFELNRYRVEKLPIDNKKEMGYEISEEEFEEIKKNAEESYYEY